MPPSLVLTALATEALEVLYQHRLLSTPQIRQILIPSGSERSAARVMDELKARRLVDCVRARATAGLGHRLWFVTKLGAEVVEAVPERAEARRRLLTPELAAGQLQAHTLAVNDVGIAFLLAARKRDHDFGPHSWRHEIAHELSRGQRGGRGLLIADAVIRYWMTLPDRRTAVRYRFIELDRATGLVDDVASKLVRYARLRDEWGQRHSTRTAHEDGAPGWPLLYRHFPGIILVLANPGRASLQSRLASLVVLCRAEAEIGGADGLAVSFVFFDELITRGPFAPTFHRISDDRPVNWLGEEVSDEPAVGELEVAC